jgi:hypothetical protein
MRAGQSLRQHFPFIAHTGVPHSDPEGVGLFYNSLIASTVSFEVGLVTMAMPTINCYRVQLASLDQSILCGHATFSSGYPFGAKEIDVIPTGAEVLVCRDKLRPYGTIVTILPVPHNRAQLYNQGDLIFPGFVSGLYREPCYSEAITRISKESNLYDFSGHRPRDMTTAGERGWMTPSGVFITINDKEACLGVNELCGLFCSRYDTYARLAGWNMDWETVSHQRQIRLDQGETFDVEGFSPYYWEGLGFYEPGQATTQEFDGQEIVFGNRPLAHYDLPENDRDRGAVLATADVSRLPRPRGAAGGHHSSARASRLEQALHGSRSADRGLSPVHR